MFNLFQPDFKPDDRYFVVTYYGASRTNLSDVAQNIAIGQSIGNPAVRSIWETDALFENHSCIILHSEEELKKSYMGSFKIAFPLANIDLSTDGISQLLAQVIGGQVDIDIIACCRVIDIEFTPKTCNHYFRGPKFGIKGIREYTGVWDKPLLGSIIKPKVIDNIDTLVRMTEQLIEGGTNFIKEDEIMANPSCCPLEDRVRAIAPLLSGTRVIYAFCINSDPQYVIDRARRVFDLGGNAVHINIWSGLGVYKSIRELDLPLFIHYQKSGDKVLTNPRHAFGINWNVLCKLATLSGADFIHAGMLGGYLDEDEKDFEVVLDTLRTGRTMPALSCGMHPGLVKGITEKIGINWMANVGGAIHGHPDGTLAGVKAMRQAIDENYGPEYNKAIDKWG